MYLDANNLYGWATSQKLLVNGFEWIIKLSQFNEDFITDYDQNDNERYFLEVENEYPKKLFNKKIENVISLLVAYMTKKTMSLI